MEVSNNKQLNPIIGDVYFNYIEYELYSYSYGGWLIFKPTENFRYPFSYIFRRMEIVQVRICKINKIREYEKKDN